MRRSANGELTHRQFLRQCPRVVDGYEPSVHQPPGTPGTFAEGSVHVDGDTVWVDTVEARHSGRLVREDWHWKVVAEGSFRLGRSPHQTVSGYLEAYASGDCERVADFVTEATWSASGGSRDEYVDACASAMPEADGAQDLVPQFLGIEDPVTAADEVTVEVTTGVLLPAFSYPFHEDVRLVEERLEWRIDAADGVDGQLDAVTTIPVTGALVDESAVLTSSRHERVELRDLPAAAGLDEGYGGQDAEEALRDAGFVANAWAEFETSDPHRMTVEVSLWRFATDEGARGYAERLNDLILAGGTLHEPVETAVPGFDDAFGATERVHDDVEIVHIIAARRDFVVEVRLWDIGEEYTGSADADPNEVRRAAEVLQAQIDRLPDAAGD